MKDFDYHPPDVPLSVLYGDRHILVVDKPAGLLSVPGKLEGRADCLETRLRRTYPNSLLVHRLDCDTSGVMIFARSKQAQGFLGQEFEQRRAKRPTSRACGVFLVKITGKSICRFAPTGQTVRARWSIL